MVYVTIKIEEKKRETTLTILTRLSVNVAKLSFVNMYLKRRQGFEFGKMAFTHLRPG